MYMYLYSKDIFVILGQTMDFFVSEPKLASVLISKSVPVVDPVSVEVDGSVKALQYNYPITNERQHIWTYRSLAKSDGVSCTRK